MDSTGRIAVVVALSLGTGCAHIPDATVHYYLSQTTITAKVTRSLACDANKELYVMDTVALSSQHSADRGEPREISLKPLKGLFTDSTIKFDLSEDGRLKGINATGEGKGEDILKAAITVLSTVSVGGLKVMTTNGTTPQDPCEYIKARGSDGKSLTIVYESDVNLKERESPIKPDLKSETHEKALRSALGPVCALVSERKVTPAPVQKAAGHDYVLKVRQPGTAKLEVKGGQNCGRLLGAAGVFAGQLGAEYDLPVPRAVIFGKESMQATFGESGVLTLIQYGSSPGAGQLLNVVNSGLTAINDRTTKKTAELNAEADLIKAQERLVKCKANHADC